MTLLNVQALYKLVYLSVYMRIELWVRIAREKAVRQRQLVCVMQRHHRDGGAAAAGERVSAETDEEMVVRQGRVRHRRRQGIERRFPLHFPTRG